MWWQASNFRTPKSRRERERPSLRKLRCLPPFLPALETPGTGCYGRLYLSHMPGYEPISAIASSLATEEATLLDFHRKGWIQARERGGTLFASADQRYRAKYILHLLQIKHLTNDQVQVVLENQRPPYSAAQVDEILKQHAVPVGTGTAS